MAMGSTDMQTGIRFIKDWSDEEFPRLAIIVTDQQVRLVTEVFGGASEIHRMVEQLSQFQQQVTNAPCTLHFDKFYQEFAYGSMLITLEGRSENVMTLHVTIRSSSASPWQGQATLKLQTDNAALTTFIQSLTKLAGKGNHRALLACRA